MAQHHHYTVDIHLFLWCALCFHWNSWHFTEYILSSTKKPFVTGCSINHLHNQTLAVQMVMFCTWICTTFFLETSNSFWALQSRSFVLIISVHGAWFQIHLVSFLIYSYIAEKTFIRRTGAGGEETTSFLLGYYSYWLNVFEGPMHSHMFYKHL